MKTLLLFGAAFLFALNVSVAQDNKEAAKGVYFVKSPHTVEQCMSVLVSMKEKGDDYLSKYYFGCKSGDHTAYAVIEGESEDAVRQKIPAEVRASSKIVKVDKFSSDQIAKMHDKMKSSMEK